MWYSSISSSIKCQSVDCSLPVCLCWNHKSCTSGGYIGSQSSQHIHRHTTHFLGLATRATNSVSKLLVASYNYKQSKTLSACRNALLFSNHQKLRSYCSTCDIHYSFTVDTTMSLYSILFWVHILMFTLLLYKEYKYAVCVWRCTWILQSKSWNLV